MEKLGPKIKKTMRKVTAMHALVGALCLSIAIFCIMTGNTIFTIIFSIFTVINMAGIATITFFYKKGYV